jgi:hypothetical protein
MPTCAKGHDSATADYCDVCGLPIAGADRIAAGAPAAAGGAATPWASPPSAGPAAPPGPAVVCPTCGTPQSGRFCERDGYDFVAASLTAGSNPAAPAVAAPENGAAQPVPDAMQSPAGAPEGTQSPAEAPESTQWTAVVGAERAYFNKVLAAGGPAITAMTFPLFYPERRFPLRGPQILVGRRSRSRGVYPEIDLTGPPEDPGVSHTHALLIAQPEGGWAVVDLGSANGTYVNDPTGPIAVNVPVPVKAGDRIYLGAWTVLTLESDQS